MISVSAFLSSHACANCPVPRHFFSLLYTDGTDPNAETLATTVKADSGADAFPVYGATKFIQLLGAHWWRRQLGSSATVLAVSPGMVGGTGLGRHLDVQPNMDNMKDVLTVDQGTSIFGEKKPHVDF